MGQEALPSSFESGISWRLVEATGVPGAPKRLFSRRPPSGQRLQTNNEMQIEITAGRICC